MEKKNDDVELVRLSLIVLLDGNANEVVFKTIMAIKRINDQKRLRNDGQSATLSGNESEESFTTVQTLFSNELFLVQI